MQVIGKTKRFGKNIKYVEGQSSSTTAMSGWGRLLTSTLYRIDKKEFGCLDILLGIITFEALK